MSSNKTIETDNSVSDYLSDISDRERRDDCIYISEMMSKVSGFPPKMWGASIVGFGSCHYRYDSGREGDAPYVAFSSRRNAIVLYLSAEFEGKDELLNKFGKHKSGKGCIYIKRLTDIDENVLRSMIANSIQSTKQRYPDG